MMINIVGLLGLLLSSSLGSSAMLLSSPFDPMSVKNHPAEMMKSTEKLSSKEQEKAVDDHLIVAQEKAAAASEVFDEVTRLLEDVTAGKLAAASDSIQSKPEENFQKTEKCIQETIEKGRDVAANVEHTVLDTVDSVKEKISETAATAKDTAARAVEKTKEAAEGAYDISSSTLGSAKEKMSDVIRSVKERLEEAVDLAKDSKKETSDAAESTKNSVLGTHRTWKHVFFSRPKGFHLSLLRLLHLFTFSIISGSAMWVTFVSGLILSTSLPRQQFAYVQSRIFPIYLTILATGELVLCLLHSLLHPWFSADRLERWQLQNIVWTLIATLFNLLVLEPWETKALYQKLKLEKLEEGRRVHETTTTPEDTLPVEQEAKQMKIEEINKKLKTLHMYSSTLNVLTLAGLMWHLWYLARRCVI
ncbi:unnamed protein product [Sphagnum troendelagicum]|uniref:TMEM205-like domain-containing protein n=1 Tax=Sphagnum troendelagicum TaxID=128251 RepID=A0ABP0UYS2_9BRYO